MKPIPPPPVERAFVRPTSAAYRSIRPHSAPTPVPERTEPTKRKKREPREDPLTPLGLTVPRSLRQRLAHIASREGWTLARTVRTLIAAGLTTYERLDGESRT